MKVAQTMDIAGSTSSPLSHSPLASLLISPPLATILPNASPQLKSSPPQKYPPTPAARSKLGVDWRCRRPHIPPHTIIIVIIVIINLTVIVIIIVFIIIVIIILIIVSSII